MKRANIYIDGFNFYYGIKNTPYKWMNFHALCKKICPRYHFHRLRYFTSLIKPPPDDPHKRQRQLTYIRALKTLPNLSVHYGQFVTHDYYRPLAHGEGKVKIRDTREKGSDVNLASYLLVDGFLKEYDVAIIISNDSDLAEPIRLVREVLGLKVGILNARGTPSAELRDVATFYRRVRNST